MSGQGKYTTYVPVASVRNTRLGRLFKGSETIESPFASTMETGDNEQARKDTVARGTEFLRPDVQAGDPNYYPNGVHMDFTGDPNGATPPDLEKVKWQKPGDPANGYFADLTSPGPGITDPKARDVDPEISKEEIKGAGYIPGQPGVSTASSPTSRISQIRQANTLGEAMVLGKNSPAEPSGF